MRRWMAAIVAILTVMLSCFGGLIVGAIAGALTSPVQLFDRGTSDPELLLIGAFFGLLVGFYFGIWAAMGIMDRAAAKSRPWDPSTRNAGSLEDRSR